MGGDTEAFGTYAPSGFWQSYLHWLHRIPNNATGRKLALALRKPFIKAVPSPVDAEMQGIRMRVYLHGNISERKFLTMPQFVDVYERQCIREHLPVDGVFIDIGANAGIYTLNAARHLGPKGQVLAIEPHPVMRGRIATNVALNDFSATINIAPYGVSAEEGTFRLHLHGSNLGESSLVHSHGENEGIEVLCKPLEAILAEYGIDKVDMLKIDIEGAEDKALMPFFQTAPAELFPQWIIIEDSRKEWDTGFLPLLETRGYAIDKVARMNLVLHRQ